MGVPERQGGVGLNVQVDRIGHADFANSNFSIARTPSTPRAIAAI